ncbi:hypothetical protein HU200_042584 [Digitaria exilis]|uniref:TFIIS central domain-containing protein n=1 Tax=Digitaria exilis TaxID=1010633 RepID=A0A835B5K2_9POAL|nr:hypothetical protein HU200_042584 [Digitaria exilis]
MEGPSKQPALAPGGAAASRSLLPADSTKPASHGKSGAGNLGAKGPTSAYLIVPVGGHPAQVGASSPDAPHRPGERPVAVSRVSLRPPQHVLMVQPPSPGIHAPQPSPSATGKKMPSPSLKVSATSKRSVQKEPLLKAHLPELSETVRSNFRETLAAALCVDADQQSVQQSASNVSPIVSSGEMKHPDDGTLERSNTCTSHCDSKADAGTNPKSVGRISKQDDILSCRILGSNMTIKVSKDAPVQSIHVRLENDVLGNNIVASDVLQGHRSFCAPHIAIGASDSIPQLNSKRATTSGIDSGATVSLNEPEFKRRKTSDGSTGEKKDIIKKEQSLAHVIEEELFKLFGGVNKKYKEKGRSLLFNLKDRSNPVLRERVLSGEITPKCLCSMTTDQLASKELSAWRLAKAEELAKMVVLPNREVNVGRLVRKTHKGEFHVEVEETNSISVGVELGSDLLSHAPSKSNEGRTKSDDIVSVHRGDLGSDNTVQEGFAGIGNSNLLSNVGCLSIEKNDYIQERVVHDLKYTENLPEIMSLDEFVEAPDSDIPLEFHSTKTAQDDRSCTPEKNHIGEDNADPSEVEFMCDTSLPEKHCQASIKSPENGSIDDLSPAKQPKGCFGVRPSTIEWRHFVEIKGRVRLSDFQDFLEQLPKSRSRAVTIVDSYFANERVGLLKVAEGVELYICPSRGKASQILTEHMAKEHWASQTMAGVSVIGVFVCRRPHICAETPTRHDDSKKQPMSISRKQQAVLSSSVPMSSQLSRPASHFGYSNERPRLKDDATGDVPPGFGCGVIKDDDDLPEYDFVSISDGSPNVATPHSYQRQQHVQAISPSEDQVRRLVRKYGSMFESSAQPWDRDSTLPEWHRSHSGHQYNTMQQQQGMISPQLSSPISQERSMTSIPQQRSMTMRQPWNHQHMLHPAEAQSGWPEWHMLHPAEAPSGWPDWHMLHPAEAPSGWPDWHMLHPAEAPSGWPDWHMLHPAEAQSGWHGWRSSAWW